MVHKQEAFLLKTEVCEELSVPSQILRMLSRNLIAKLSTWLWLGLIRPIVNVSKQLVVLEDAALVKE